MLAEDFRDFIKDAYLQRRKDEPALTLTKFAQELGMSPQKLNSILHQSAGLSTSSARKVAAGLKLGTETTNYFVDLVDSAHHRSSTVRAEAEERTKLFRRQNSMDTLAPEDFAPIARWQSVAAFVLVETTDFKPDMAWAAKRLGFSVEQTKAIYDDLFELGFLRIEGDQWVCDSFTLNVEATESAEPLRAYYSELSQKAVDFLSENPPDKRHFASAVVSVSEDDLDFIRLEIETFRKALVAKLDVRSQVRERVCVLNLQCFPLDRSFS